MITVKKLATIGAAAALLASTAVPALAWGSWHSSDDLLVKQKNTAEITNSVYAGANTGNNKIKASEDVESGKIKTGDATTGVEVTNLANENKARVNSCDCFDDVTIKQRNSATLSNSVYADSNTGGNKIKAYDDVDWGKIRTGDALTGVSVSSVVNSNVAKVN